MTDPRAMTAHSIPDDIKDFIVQHIQSIAQLEALLLLLNSARGLTLEECASRLYIAAPDCEVALQQLIASKLIKLNDGRFLFRREDEEVARKVKQLAEVYRQQLIPVTNLIHARQERVQKFADAFRVRKEP